jgi:ribonuclease HII
MATIKIKPDFEKDYYESLAWQEGAVLCGVDEVGRGCLAGPVASAAVILYPGASHELLQDSKILTPAQRKISYDWIINHSWHAVSLVNSRVIDTTNIYQATLLAMQRAITQLCAQVPQLPSMIVVDSMPVRLDFFDKPVIAFNFGESKSSSIAAASIVAKVTRDAILAELHKSSPGYGHDQHKGYSTPMHKQKLIAHGASILHRISFIDHLPVILPASHYTGDKADQQSLWLNLDMSPHMPVTCEHKLS